MLFGHVGHGRTGSAMNIEERRVVAKPIETLEDISLDENNLEKYIRVRVDMEKKMKQDLV